MEFVSNEDMWAGLPADLTDTDVVSVQVTAPFTVRVTHKDGTCAEHLFAPEDFRNDFVRLRDPATFATAQVVEGDTLGWVLPDGRIFDQAPDALWLHAHGLCDGSCGHPPSE